jgi:hypothetical protein
MRAVEDVIKNGLGYKEVQVKYGIKGNSTVQLWERIYREEGAEGLYKYRKTRAVGNVAAKTVGVLKLEQKSEQELYAELARLRAEVDYLKKLNALVSERVQREKKHK